MCGRVCSLASFKRHSQTIAQNDRGKHGGVDYEVAGVWGVLRTIILIHTSIANPFIHTSLPSLPLRFRQLIAVKTCLIESFQANPQAWTFVGPLLVNIH